MAIARRRPRPGLIHHSDCGSQYACEAYRRTLTASGVLPCMSREGDCLDNASTESFFHSIRVSQPRRRLRSSSSGSVRANASGFGSELRSSVSRTRHTDKAVSSFDSSLWKTANRYREQRKNTA